MANIGKPQRIIEVEPMQFPSEEPVREDPRREQPTVPEREKEPAKT